MSTKDTGGTAFHQFEVVAGERDGHGDIIESYTVAKGGMSLRDYFAARAMHAELNTAGQYRPAALALSNAAKQAGQTIEERVAFNAYRIADAMLAERAKGGAQ